MVYDSGFPWYLIAMAESVPLQISAEEALEVSFRALTVSFSTLKDHQKDAVLDFTKGGMSLLVYQLVLVKPLSQLFCRVVLMNWINSNDNVTRTASSGA